MKRVICLFLVLCFLSSSVIVASAANDEYVPEWLAFTYDTANTISGFDGSDEQFNSYMQNTTQAAKYGAVVQALEQINNDNLGNLPRVPMNVVFNGTLDPTIEKYDGKFRAMVANRDYIDGLYSLTNGSGENNRFKGLSEYGLQITGDYNVNDNITTVGNPCVAQNSNSLSSYIDLSSARNYSGLSFFSGTNYPPCVYVPNNGTGELYQNGVKLAGNHLYYLIANNLCFSAYGTGPSSYNYYLYYINHYNSDDFNKMRIDFKATNTLSYNEQTGFYTVQTPSTTQKMYRFVNGVVTPSGTTISDDLNLEILSQFEKSIGINISFDNDTSIPVPDNIPYDNNNNVIIMIPTTNNNDITYNHVYYMPITTYKDYVDNSQVTYNDYQYDETNTTINNIINMYFGDSGNGEFDDSRIVSRLDTIIGKLNDILSIIGKFGGEVFSNTPIYDKFTDCITDHVNYIDEYSDISTELTPNNTNDGIEEISIYYDSDDMPNDLGIQNINVDVSWYEKYRIRVRTLLKIPVILLCISYTWTIFKRSFGVGD